MIQVEGLKGRVPGLEFLRRRAILQGLGAVLVEPGHAGVERNRQRPLHPLPPDDEQRFEPLAGLIDGHRFQTRIA